MSETLRRSATLALHWEDGRLVCEDYLLRRRVELSSAMVELLDRFSEPADPAHVARSMGPDAGEAKQAIGRLKASGLLKNGKSPEERRLERWHWGHAARQFALGTKDAHRFIPRERRMAHARGLMRRSHQPALYKSYRGRQRVLLKRPEQYASSANEALAGVRNTRDFAGKPISRKALSEILMLAWGEHGKIHPKPWGTLLEKTSYSGGNRHPVEVYPVVVSVDGLKPGLYHYDVRRHGLELLKAGNFGTVANRIGNRQEWIKGAAVYFLMTGLWARTMFKYRHDYVMRAVFFDVGHLSQSMYVSATGLGLGACTTYALNHTLAERFIGIDGVDESFLALSMVGVPRLLPPRRRTI